MSAIDHDYIYLQPPCCADEDVGRLWCEDPDPTDCDDGKHWTKYVRSDIYESLRSRVAECEQALVNAAAWLEADTNEIARDILSGLCDSNDIYESTAHCIEKIIAPVLANQIEGGE